MSGLEVIGAAASIIQIADAGLKLYDYIESVATANKRLKRVSKNLETTCNVVKEIGEVFQQKETVRLVSKSAVKTARDAAEECEEVFIELQTAITKSEKNKYLFPLKEAKLELLAVQLEKLKSTLMLLMTVLLNARDLQTSGSKAEHGKVQELIRARDIARTKYDELRRNHHLLVSQFPSASAQLLSTAADGKDPATRVGTHSSNSTPRKRSVFDGTASLDANTRIQGKAGSSSDRAMTGGTSSMAHETLDTCILQISQLLEDIKGMKEVMDDVQAASRARKIATAMYRNVRLTLDDVLIDAESPSRKSREERSGTSVQGEGYSRGWHGGNRSDVLPGNDNEFERPVVKGIVEKPRKVWPRDQHTSRRETDNRYERNRDRIRGGYTHVPNPHPSRSAPDLLSPDHDSSRFRSQSADAQPAPEVVIYSGQSSDSGRSSSPGQHRFPYGRKGCRAIGSGNQWRDRETYQQRSRIEELQREKKELLTLQAKIDFEAEERAESERKYGGRPRWAIQERTDTVRSKSLDEREARQRAELKKLQEKIDRRSSRFGFQENQLDAILDPAHVARRPRDVLRPEQVPTYLKAHRKNVDIQTLEYYKLPWEHDEDDPNYFVILQEMDSDDMEILFEHTRKLRHRGSPSSLEGYGRRHGNTQEHFAERSENACWSTRDDSDDAGGDHSRSDSLEGNDHERFEGDDIRPGDLVGGDDDMSRTEREYARGRSRSRSRVRSSVMISSPPGSDPIEKIEEPDEVDELLHEWTTLYDDEGNEDDDEK